MYEVVSQRFREWLDVVMVIFLHHDPSMGLSSQIFVRISHHRPGESMTRFLFFLTKTSTSLNTTASRVGLNKSSYLPRSAADRLSPNRTTYISYNDMLL